MNYFHSSVHITVYILLLFTIICVSLNSCGFWASKRRIDCELSYIGNVCVDQVDASTHTLAKYLMELTIVEYDLVSINPSEIAAASLCLAMKLSCDTPDWVSFIVQLSYRQHYTSWSYVCPSICPVSVDRNLQTKKLGKIKKFV